MFFVEDLPASPRLWHVCFTGVKLEMVWDRFLTSGYRHVFLLGFLPEYQAWIRYEVLYDRTMLSLISGQQAGRLLSIAMREGGVLAWPAHSPRPPSFFFRFGLYCVPAMKHVLGLRCVAATPKQLHDFLRKRGAKPLIEDVDELRSATSAAGRPGG